MPVSPFLGVATASDAGRSCPYCRFPIKQGGQVAICGACRAPHHAECWEENGGCAVVGCAAGPGPPTEVRRAVEPAEQRTSPLPGAPPPSESRPPESRPPESRPSGSRVGLFVGVGIGIAAVAAAAAVFLLSGTGTKGGGGGPTGDSGSGAGGPTVSATIAKIIAPLQAPQQAVSADLVVLSNSSASSYAQLGRGAASLNTRVLVAEGTASGLAPAGASGRRAAQALTRFLHDDETYASQLSLIASQRSVTAASAAQARSRAALARGAYSSVLNASGQPCCAQLSFTGTERLPLLVVSQPARPRILELTPLLVGFGPDDPPGLGRCFGPYTSQASLTVGGRVYGSNFIQCGDYGNRAPWRASGTYNFRRTALPAGARIVLSALAVVDGNSGAGQIGSTVTWAVDYAGSQVCSTSLTWEGSATPGTQLYCTISVTQPADASQLSITQNVNLAGSGSFWAGLIAPRITPAG